MKRLLILLAGTAPLLFLALATVPARADTLDISDPGTNSRFPFGYDVSATNNYQSGSTYQQLYTAQDFSGPILISSIAFATSSDLSNARLASYSLDVHLGVAATSAFAPSTTFANNRGPSYQDVYTGNYSFVPQNSDVFDFVLNLSTPYLYDPTVGDLLFDVKLTGTPVIGGTVIGGTELYFDGDLSGDGSRVFNAASGASTGLSNGFTLYTEFGYTPESNLGSPTPEPATAGLLGAAGLALWMAKRRRA